MNPFTDTTPEDCGGCDNGECCGSCPCCTPLVPVTRDEVYFQGRDQYGRSTYFNYSLRGIVVTMPRRTAHVRPAGENYLVNLHDGTNPGQSTVRYFKTLNAAKDFYLANAARR